MHLTVEQIADEALALPSEPRALLADCLVESLDPTEDGYPWYVPYLRCSPRRYCVL